MGGSEDGSNAGILGLLGFTPGGRQTELSEAFWFVTLTHDTWMQLIVPAQIWLIEPVQGLTSRERTYILATIDCSVRLDLGVERMRLLAQGDDAVAGLAQAWVTVLDGETETR